MTYTARRTISRGPEEQAATGRDPPLPADGHTVIYAVEAPFERRIGRRVAVDGLPAAFSDRPGRTVLARLVEVSVTGAAMLVPADARITEGARGRLTHQAVDTLVDVRRVDPGPDDATKLVSVEFVDLSGPLADEIHAFLERYRAGADHEHA